MTDESKKSLIRLAGTPVKEPQRMQESHLESDIINDNPLGLFEDNTHQKELLQLKKFIDGSESLSTFDLSHIAEPRCFDISDFLPPKPEQPLSPTPAKKERLARKDQITKERCQAVAKLKWKENLNYTIADLSVHPDIFNKDITGGQHYDQRTIYGWLSEVDPRKNKPGRPAKDLKKK